jgi:spoIIIJ-associated protein
MPSTAHAILQETLQHLGFAATIEEHPIEDGVLLDIKTDDASASHLIGRAGQTLSDLQYLTNRLVFRLDPTAPKVTVDVGGHRAQVRDALVKRAKHAADKVRRWNDAVELEPMNAYDRRIIHHALKDDPTVETSSVEVEGTSKKSIVIRPRR